MACVDQEDCHHLKRARCKEESLESSGLNRANYIILMRWGIENPLEADGAYMRSTPTPYPRDHRYQNRIPKLNCRWIQMAIESFGCDSAVYRADHFFLGGVRRARCDTPLKADRKLVRWLPYEMVSSTSYSSVIAIISTSLIYFLPNSNSCSSIKVSPNR